MPIIILINSFWSLWHKPRQFLKIIFLRKKFQFRCNNPFGVPFYLTSQKRTIAFILFWKWSTLFENKTNSNSTRFDLDILPFVESQWEMFQPPQFLRSIPNWERCDRILDVLLKHKDRFGSVRIRKKELDKSVWWLNVVAPPPGPRFRVPTFRWHFRNTFKKL